MILCSTRSILQSVTGGECGRKVGAQARVMFAVERATGAQRRGSGRGEAVRHARMCVEWCEKGVSHAHVREKRAQVRVFGMSAVGLLWMVGNGLGQQGIDLV